MAKDNQTHSGITETDIVGSVEELETPIAKTDLPPKTQREIPILYDVVDAAEVAKYNQTGNILANSISADETKNFPNDRLNELVDAIDQKLSNELDGLVSMLKDTIKKSIIDELKEQLKKDVPQTQTPPSNEDRPDKLPE